MTGARRRAPAEPPALTREIIVRQALALLQEGGLKEVTLRGIATRLGVRAPSLYWHVPDKSALMGLMTHAVVSDWIGALPPAADWREWLFNFGMRLWRMQSGLRDCSRLMQEAGWEEAWLEAFVDRLCDELAARGVARPLAMKMHAGVQSLVTGWTGFAHGPNGDFFERAMEGGAQTGLADNLHAMIEGWASAVDAAATAR